jgi:hypothetical protein
MTGEQLQLWDDTHACDTSRGSTLLSTQDTQSFINFRTNFSPWVPHSHSSTSGSTSVYGFHIVEVCHVFLYLVCRSTSGVATCEGHVVVRNSSKLACASELAFCIVDLQISSLQKRVKNGGKKKKRSWKKKLFLVGSVRRVDKT